MITRERERNLEAQVAAQAERLAKQSAALRLAREAIDWCVAEINRDSPSVMNGRKALAAINEVIGENNG